MERGEIPEGYEVRPLEEEFREELEQFDGTIPEDMNFGEYADYLEGEEPEMMEQADNYSED